MITKTEKEEIKKIIGHRYAALVQAELCDKNEFDSEGKPYSTNFITNVMNGVGNATVEAAIYRVVETKKAEIKKRKELLEAS